MLPYIAQKKLKTDAIVWKIDMEITINDTSVNVDNFVENGDFFCGQLLEALKNQGKSMVEKQFTFERKNVVPVNCD